jgi:hypothetical protein
LLRKVPVVRKVPVLRNVFRPKRLPPAVLPTPDDLPRELSAERRPVPQPAEPTAAGRSNRPRPVAEPAPARAAAPQPTADEPETVPQASKVVEFEAPTEDRAERVERTVRRERPVPRRAARPRSPEPLDAEPLLRGAETASVREMALAAPRGATRELEAERVRELARPRSISPLQTPLHAGPALDERDEPLSSSLATDTWPELPPPLDEGDGDVDVALRAWERQQRLAREQSRL